MFYIHQFYKHKINLHRIILFNSNNNKNRQIYLSSAMIQWQGRKQQSTSLEALVTSGLGGL